MPFENNGASQKWHMTSTPPEIDNLVPTKMVPYKNAHLAKKCQGLC